MPKAKKLKSGSWRCQVYAGYGPDGKRRYESFTVRDPSRAGKKECERLAAEWSQSRKERSSREMTVEEIIKKYINLKEKVLSPSTIKNYDQIVRTSLDDIRMLAAGDLTTPIVQAWINVLAARNSPKYVRNANGLLQSSLKFSGLPGIQVTLPAPVEFTPHVPCDDEVKQLIDYIVDTTYDDTRRDMRPRYELKIAVMLAAFGSLRRGEICALRVEDFDREHLTVRINKDVVKDKDGYWVTKPTPKTSTSNRTVELPRFVLDAIDFSRPGTIIKGTPDQISNRFRRAVRFSRVKFRFRFHDLRHYYVSIAHALGVPDAYIKDRFRPDPLADVQSLQTQKNRINTGVFTPTSAYAIPRKNGDDGIRTRDLSVANAALSQLSYVPEYCPGRITDPDNDVVFSDLTIIAPFF